MKTGQCLCWGQDNLGTPGSAPAAGTGEVPVPWSQHSWFAHRRICSLLPSGWFARVGVCALPSPAPCAAEHQGGPCSLPELCIAALSVFCSQGSQQCKENVPGRSLAREAGWGRGSQRGWNALPSPVPAMGTHSPSLAGTAAPKDNGTDGSRCNLSCSGAKRWEHPSPEPTQGLASVTTPALSSCLTGSGGILHPCFQ